MEYRNRIVAAGLASLVVLAGCAAPAPATNPPAPGVTTSAAAENTAPPAAPQAPSPGEVVDAEALLGAMAEAAKSVKSSKTEMTVELGQGSSAVRTKATGLTDSSDPDHSVVSMTMELAGMPVDVIMDGDDFYMRLELNDGKWIKLTREEMESQGLDSPAAIDQNAMFDNLKNSVTKAVFVGEEKVGGTPARHYRLSVDSAQFDPENGEAGTIVDYDIWVDDLYRTVKMRYSSDAQSGVNATMEMLVSGFNEPVNIKIPAAGELMPQAGDEIESP